MALFTVETAAEMGRRSAELAKQRKLEQEQQRALVLAEPTLPTVLETDFTRTKAERTRKQLELIDQMIEQADDADTLDALTRSKERLFRIWARLAQLPSDPKPVQLKQPKPTQALPEPTMLPAPANPGQDQGKP